MKKNFTFVLIILVVSCSNNENGKISNEIDSCNCILDELVERRMSIDSSKINIHNELEVEASPNINSTIKKLVDLDISLRLKYNDSESEESNRVTSSARDVDFDKKFIQNYLSERELFCAKYKAYCRDKTIPDSIKTKFYLEELEKLNQFMREIEVTKKKEPTKRKAFAPQEIVTTKQENTYGDNINVQQGDNSFFDNSKNVVQKKLKTRLISEEAKLKLMDKIKACNGTEIDVKVVNEEQETLQLAKQILDILKEAGIKNQGLIHTLQPSDYKGIGIEMPIEYNDCQKLIAHGFYNILDFKFDFWDSDPNYTYPEVVIVIGSNPENYYNE
ncbi:MAG: hypothetical protein KDE33_27950 [Bacteroidetes bacterium]|nr:hypothetical protein [Bacteroidota bacterium]